MKKVILSSIFTGLAVAAVATATGSPLVLDQRLGLQSQASKEVSSQSALLSLSQNRLMNENELRQFAAAASYFQLDSIVGLTGNGVEPSQRQYFMYDSHKYPVKRINSYWNGRTHAWDAAEIYEYVWDEDGYCLVQSAVSSAGGQKLEFEYNDRHLGIVQVLYNYVDGEWVPQQRGEYTYDDAGNITEEVISQWMPETSTWSKLIKNVAVWDNLNRQTDFAKYEWTGTTWKGSGERKIFGYLDDSTNVYTLNGWYLWDEAANDWFYFMKREFRWNSDGQLTSQTEDYFNKDTNAWDGCYPWYNDTKYNKLTIINYDSKKRITDETYSESHEVGQYVAMSDIMHRWKDLTDGTSEETVISRALRGNRDPWAEKIVLQDSTIRRYNAAGQETLMEEWRPRGTALSQYGMTEKTYDSNGYLASEYNYSPNRQVPGEWVGATGINYTNDADGNVTEQLSVTWNRTANDWVNNNRFVNEYQNGVQTKQLAYKWRDDVWNTNYGSEQFYDFDVAVSDLILWPGADFIYKLNEMRSYTGNGTGWDYMANVYHYSEVQRTGVDEIADADSAVKISFNGQTVTVSGEEAVATSIYDAAGRLVVMTSESTIDMSECAPGLYIVKAGDASKKIMK